MSGTLVSRLPGGIVRLKSHVPWCTFLLQHLFNIWAGLTASHTHTLPKSLSPAVHLALPVSHIYLRPRAGHCCTSLYTAVSVISLVIWSFTFSTAHPAQDPFLTVQAMREIQVSGILIGEDHWEL